MPIYEYVCDRCGQRMEALQKVDAPAPSACEFCAAPTLRRKLSRVSFRLKGGGWYETDFKTGDERRHLASGDSESGGDKGHSDANDGDGRKDAAGADAGSPRGAEAPASGKEAAKPAGDSPPPA